MQWDEVNSWEKKPPNPAAAEELPRRTFQCICAREFAQILDNIFPELMANPVSFP